VKPFLGIDLTTDKKNEQTNGAAFLIAEPSPALTRALERSVESAGGTLEQTRLSLPLRFVQWLCGVVGALAAIVIIGGSIGRDGIPLAEGYQKDPWLFWTAGACLLVWLILKILSRQKEKTVLERDENTHVFSNLDGVIDAIFTDLLIPSDAKDVDLLSFYYKTKGSELKVCEKAMQITPYSNPLFKLFADSENLYIADLEGKYAFPLSSLRSIRTVKKTIRIPDWNKDEAYNKGVYKQYKLSTDNYNCIHCKTYHILEIDHNGELWGIYFPCYELPVFEAVTGLTAQQS